MKNKLAIVIIILMVISVTIIAQQLIGSTPLQGEISNIGSVSPAPSSISDAIRSAATGRQSSSIRNIGSMSRAPSSISDAIRSAASRN